MRQRKIHIKLKGRALCGVAGSVKYATDEFKADCKRCLRAVAK